MFARVSSDTTIKVVQRRSYAWLGLQKQILNPLLFCFVLFFFPGDGQIVNMVKAEFRRTNYEFLEDCKSMRRPYYLNRKWSRPRLFSTRGASIKADNFRSSADVAATHKFI